MPRLNLTVDALPKRLFCKTADALPFTCEIPIKVKFPCYVEDYGMYVTLYSDGLCMVLINPDSVDTSKETIAYTRKWGHGLDTLGKLDPMTLGDIDALSFDELTRYAADWLTLKQSAAKFGVLRTLGDFDRFTLGELDSTSLL